MPDQKFIFSFILVSLLTLTFPIKGQNLPSYEWVSQLPMSIAGEELPLALAGGLNAPQFNTMDLNGDELEDLVIFERSSGRILTFLNLNKSYQYAPDYAQLFPADVINFMILIDYDGDGKKDLFTSTSFGIKVYQHVSKGKTPRWQLKSPYLKTKEGINVQVNGTDIPAITDVNGDGDLDILAYNFAVGGFIEYYENLSLEDNKGLSELVFEKKSMAWGDFEECDCNVFSFGKRCDGSALSSRMPRKAIQHAGGKSILLRDFNGDGLKDLLIGHELCPELYFLPNTGTPEKAKFESFSNRFPTNSPANFHIFPAAYWLENTASGTPQLIVSTNAPDNVSDMIDFQQSVWQYSFSKDSKNQPTLKSKSFLQAEMIDLGEHAYPMLIDFDRDGLTDLLLSSRGTLKKGKLISQVYYFKNTGSKKAPTFTLIQDDLWQLSKLQLKDMKPQLVDLDGDGKLDLIISYTDGLPYRKKFYWIAGKGTYDFDIKDKKPLTVSLRAKDDFIFKDLNKDQKADLLVGSMTGELITYMQTKPEVFEISQRDHLGISDNPTRRNLTLAIADINQDGTEDLLTTDYSGRLTVYLDFLNKTPTKELLYVHNKITQSKHAARLGYQNWLSAGVLFGSDLQDILIGTSEGGIRILQARQDNLPTIQLSGFPNPATEEINLIANQSISVQMYNQIGLRVGQKIILTANEITTVSLTNIPSGTYIIQSIDDPQVRYTFLKK